MDRVEKTITSVLGKEAEQFDYTLKGKKRRGWRTFLLRTKHSVNSKAAKLVEANWRALYEEGVQLFVGPGKFKIGPNEYADSWGEATFDPADGPPPEDPLAKSPPSVDQVIALPGVKAIDIIEFCRVGSHNDFPPDPEWQKRLDRVPAALKKLAATLPPEQRAMIESKLAQMNAGVRRRGPRVYVEQWVTVQKGMAKIAKIVPFAIQFADQAGLRATLLKKVTKPLARKIAMIVLTVNPEAMDVMANELGVADDGMDPEGLAINYIITRGQIRMWWD